MSLTTSRIILDSNLSPQASRLAYLLDLLGRRRGEVCHATETLATRLGCSARSVRTWLAELIARGLVRRVVDFRLRTRRRLQLLWFGQEDTSSPANECHDCRQVSAVSPAPPPDPPIVESGDRETPEGASAGHDTPPPPPSRKDEDRPDETEAPPRRRATAEEIGRLKSTAAAASPTDPTFPTWTIRLARHWGVSWVTAAAARVVELSRSETVRRPRGLMVRLLNDYRAEGGPPPSPPSPEDARAAAKAAEDAKWAEILRRFEARANARGES